jgi:hypothetical protein
MKVKVHVQGIKGSGLIESPGEDPSVLFNGVLEVDGHLIEECGGVEVSFGGGEMMSVKAYLTPGSFEVVTHTRESWPELLAKIDASRNEQAETGTGRVLALTKVEAD